MTIHSNVFFCGNGLEIQFNKSVHRKCFYKSFCGKVLLSIIGPFLQILPIKNQLTIFETFTIHTHFYARYVTMSNHSGESCPLTAKFRSYSSTTSISGNIPTYPNEKVCVYGFCGVSVIELMFIFSK